MPGVRRKRLGASDMSEDKWDDRLRLLFYGHGKENFKLVRHTIPGALEDAGFEVVWQMAYPAIAGYDVQNVLDDEDLHYKRGEYLRQLDTEKLQSAVDAVDSEAPFVQGFGVAVETTLYKRLLATVEKFPIPNSWEFELFTTPPVIGQEDWAEEPPQNQNAPFSYDPNNDYYTEPDRNPNV